MTNVRKIVPLGLGSTWIAVDASCVREVLGRTPVARVPGAPAGLAGVVPWRGRAIAVLDLGPDLGAEPLERDRARTVVLELAGDNVALPVDRVREVATGETRPTHAARIAHASLEVDVDGETLPLFDVAAWVHALDGTRE